MWGHMALSARKVETAKPGRYTDSRGLMLVVKPSGAKSWVLRYQVAGKRRDMGLGPWPDVSLAMAREKTLEARRTIALALDPLDEERKAKALTLRDAGQALIEMKRSGWRNEKHAAQWSSTLGQYAFPRLGDLDVRKISTDHVLEVLTPIWTTKPETASRVRQRIEAVLDYARAIGARDGDNPARWRGHLDRLLPQPSKVRSVAHHAALDWREMPGFMAELARREGLGCAKALAFLHSDSQPIGRSARRTLGRNRCCSCRLDYTRFAHESRKGASSPVVRRRAGAPWVAGRSRCICFSEPC